LKPFIDKFVGITSKDVSKNRNLAFTSGHLKEITNDAIVLDSFGKRVLITIESILKIKERND